MGAWGADSFDNDDASDWIADFCEAPDPTLIVKALSAVANVDASEYLEAPDCSVGIAAAEVVAAVKGAPNVTLSDEAKNCLSRLKIEAEPSLVALALKTIARIKTNSELKELWDESETPEAWYQAVSDLERRLH